LVGGIISTALALSALPELTKYASKSGYSILALLISFIVIVAPFVFTADRSGKVERDKAGNYSVVYQGTLWRFVLSCAITLFAGLAQLVVFFLLLHEIFQGFGFWSYTSDSQPWSCNLGSIMTFVLGLALCAYTCRSIYLTIDLQNTANTNATDDRAKLREGDHVGPSILSWPML
jgi:hypothetical protein